MPLCSQRSDAYVSDFLAELEAELGEQEPVEATAERPRDEMGRFAPQDQPEPEGEAVEPEPAPAQAEEPLLGKFKSTEDLAKSYEALEAKLTEQGSELGELRKLREQLEQQQYQQPESYATLDQGTVDWFDEQAMENPYGAAVWAMQNEPSGVLYNRAMDTWYQENPRQAASFERQLELRALAQEFSGRLEAQTQPFVEQSQRNDFITAWGNVKQVAPDLEEHSDQILEAAQSAPEVVAMLASGSLADKQRVIENLYYLAKGRQATSLSQAASEMAAQQASETRAAKEQAFVASSGTRPESDTRSAAETWLEDVFDEAAKQYYG